MTHYAAPGDVVKVHPDVVHNGHRLGGLLLTVVAVHHTVELEATQWTGGTPIHLNAADVDLAYHQYRRTA
jgi:hypothetical protein